MIEKAVSNADSARIGESSLPGNEPFLATCDGQDAGHRNAVRSAWDALPDAVRFISMMMLAGLCFWLAWSEYDRESIETGSATPSVNTRPVSVSGNPAPKNANAFS